MNRLAIVVALLALASSPPLRAEEREYIYGAELMSPKERDTYRREMKAAPTDDARGQYRQRHRDRLQQRARQRGTELDDKGIVRREGVGQ